MELSIRTESRDTVSIVYPEGFINAHTVSQFEQVLKDMVTGQKYHMVINCHELQYISSAGLGALMGVIEEVRDNDGDIRLCGMSESVFNVFDILGFTELYQIFDDEDRAIQSFGA